MRPNQSASERNRWRRIRAFGKSTLFLAAAAALVLLTAGGPALADQGTVTKWLQRPFAPELVTTDPMTLMQGENIGSDVDWRDIMSTDPILPNWVVADDFRSDGRPILTVRWWGSYFIPGTEPVPMKDPAGGVKYVPVIEDGFLLSFFGDIPADPTGGAPFSMPGGLLGSYIAPKTAVKITPTQHFGWDNHRIWQYEVNLQDTHLDHAGDLATPISFNEQKDVIYWLSVVAENGHEILADWTVRDTMDQPLTTHWWGWHNSPDSFNDDAVMGSLLMPTSQWEYFGWEPIRPQHNPFIDMAFELLTIPEPAGLGLALAGVGVLALCRRRQS